MKWMASHYQHLFFGFFFLAFRTESFNFLNSLKMIDEEKRNKSQKRKKKLLKEMKNQKKKKIIKKWMFFKWKHFKQSKKKPKDDSISQ